MSYLRVTVYLPTAPNGALSSSMFSEALTDNNSKRHFFWNIVAQYWKNCVLSFLRRRNEPYSSVVIYVSAPRRWLLCCCERRLDTSRQATENPVTECPLTRYSERWLVNSTSAQDSALAWLDQTAMVHSQVARNILNCCAKVNSFTNKYQNQNLNM